jgi:hypothetical protein
LGFWYHREVGLQIIHLSLNDRIVNFRHYLRSAHRLQLSILTLIVQVLKVVDLFSLPCDFREIVPHMDIHRLHPLVSEINHLTLCWYALNYRLPNLPYHHKHSDNVKHIVLGRLVY